MRPTRTNPPRRLPHMAMLVHSQSMDVTAVGPFPNAAVAQSYLDTMMERGRYSFVAVAPILAPPSKRLRQTDFDAELAAEIEAMIPKPAPPKDHG